MSAKCPQPAFNFTVEWGGQRIGFSEVSGLIQESQAVGDRGDLSGDYSSIKMPGLQNFGNITLKRGIAASGDDLFKWFSAVRRNSGECRDLVISLLNEERQPVMVWKVHNAWPLKIEGPCMNASGNEVAIESIELTHEGLELQISNEV